MTTEINPRIVDGEPVCSGAECPTFVAMRPATTQMGQCEPGGYGDGVLSVLGGHSYCIPGLRRQRDEARRDVCAPPHWTTTPPTEPGWYWMRNRGSAGVVQLVRFRGEIVFSATGLKPWSMPIGTEYWPVPIPEPPRGEETDDDD